MRRGFDEIGGQVHDNRHRKSWGLVPDWTSARQPDIENPGVWLLTGQVHDNYPTDIVKWLSGGCPCTVQPGRHDTRVFPIWVVMKSKFMTLIWVIDLFPNLGDVPNRATKLRNLINPNRENSCVMASRLDGIGTTT